MKRVALFLVPCMALLTSCSKSESAGIEKTSLTGTWKLVETLADPGDGSGIWQPAAAPLTITFHTNGQLEGNAFPQARNYNVTGNSGIRFTFADGTFINYTYTQTDATMVLSGGGCIEACGAKFVKDSTR